MYLRLFDTIFEASKFWSTFDRVQFYNFGKPKLLVSSMNVPKAWWAPLIDRL
jgi:hypothetical protein